MSDDHAAHAIWCVRQPRQRDPQLDRIVQGGMVGESGAILGAAEIVVPLIVDSRHRLALGVKAAS